MDFLAVTSGDSSALSFRRVVLSVLDVAFVPPSVFRRDVAVPSGDYFPRPSGPAAPSLCDRRQSFRRRCLFDACVSGALDPSRFYSVCMWRTALALFSRELHITPEALPEAQVEVDRLLEHLSKSARAALKKSARKASKPFRYCHRKQRARKGDQDCV